MNLEKLGDGELLYVAMFLEEQRIVRFRALARSLLGSVEAPMLEDLAAEQEGHHASLLEEWAALGGRRVPDDEIRRRLNGRIGPLTERCDPRDAEDAAREFYSSAALVARRSEVRLLFATLAQIESAHAGDLDVTGTTI